MGIDRAIDVTGEQYQALLNLLQHYLPGTEVWAYGSRVRWTSKPESDLDLVAFAEPGKRGRVAELREAFEESDLPFRVDLFVWDDIPESFHKAIESERIVLRRHPLPDRTTTKGTGQWGTLNLGCVCTKVGSGATPRGGESVYLTNGTYALIRSQNVFNNGFRWSGLAYISEVHAGELANVEVLSGDVLLNITGDSVARACQVDSNALPARVNQHVAIVRPNPEILDSRFLRYFLVAPETQQLLKSWAGSGATRNALTKSLIEQIEVYAPKDVGEQRAIAQVLGSLDDKIELNRRMNETLESISQAVFRDWFEDFGKTRDHISTSSLPTKVGSIPQGWRIYRLHEIASLQTETISPPKSAETEFEHFSIPAYDDGQFPRSEKGRGIRSNKTIVPEDAVLLSKLNPDIPRVWIPDLPRGCMQICSTEFLAFTPQSPANRSVLYSLFLSQPFRNDLSSMVTGTSKSHQRVPPKALMQLEVLPGSAESFAKFDKIIGPMITAILRNRSESNTLRNIRNTLLPKLISGEIRIPDAEKAVESIA